MHRGFINFYSVYIGWLCSAVFLHLPSFAALGIDVKADVSILLTTFLVSWLFAHNICASWKSLHHRRNLVGGKGHVEEAAAAAAAAVQKRRAI